MTKETRKFLAPFAALLASMFFSACSAVVPAPAALPNRPIVVLPAHNRTSDPLLVSGASLLDRYALHRPQVGVADVLAGEARFLLAERGFDVVAGETVESKTQGREPGSVEAAREIVSHAGLDGLLLYLEIHHWESDASTHPLFVLVGISASLVDPVSGKILWHADRRTGPVTTPGEMTLETAYETAARKVVADLLASLSPAAGR